MKKVMIALGVSVLACAPAPHAGDEIAIVEESAVIVWDAAAQTEHFIRRATFHDKGRDFGFLVPTPGVPALAEVGDEIFDKLEQRTRRETISRTRKELDFTPLFSMIFGDARPRRMARRLREEAVEDHRVQDRRGQARCRRADLGGEDVVLDRAAVLPLPRAGVAAAPGVGEAGEPRAAGVGYRS
jgi:hypothetical protein